VRPSAETACAKLEPEPAKPPTPTIPPASVQRKASRGGGPHGSGLPPTTTEPLDPLYTPAFRVDRRYEAYFRPTMITEANGELTEELREDLLALSTPGPKPSHRGARDPRPMRRG
jgi:hypothetical protein